MQKVTKKRLLFAVRSLSWGTMLFGVAMILINWSDLRSTVSGQYVVITNAQDSVIQRIGSAGIEPIQSLLNKAHTTLKSISTTLQSSSAN